MSDDSECSLIPPDTFARRCLAKRSRQVRTVKCVARPTLGFKSFRSAAATLAGVELMHMGREGQLQTPDELRPAEQFYALAA